MGSETDETDGGGLRSDGVRTGEWLEPIPAVAPYSLLDGESVSLQQQDKKSSKRDYGWSIVVGSYPSTPSWGVVGIHDTQTRHWHVTLRMTEDEAEEFGKWIQPGVPLDIQLHDVKGGMFFGQVGRMDEIRIEQTDSGPMVKIRLQGSGPLAYTKGRSLDATDHLAIGD